MKRTSLKSGGFTLVELLVVIAIITILASLTMAMITFANTKAGRERAKVEIQGLSIGLESYKIDIGDYPRDTNWTDLLDARTTPATALVITNNVVPTTSGSCALALYRALSGDLDCSRVIDATEKSNKVYFAFKPNMLYPKYAVGSGGTPPPVQAVVDPFRNVYGYSTIGSAATSGTAAQTKGYNPTFDLWSTADLDQKGLTPAAAWITNW